MKWPLKYQIMLPMTGVVLAAVIGLSVAHGYLASRRARQQITERISGVVETLVHSNFPMTDSVLRQMKGLAGAELLLQDADGRILASTQSRWTTDTAAELAALDGPAELRLVEPVVVGGRRFYHAGVNFGPAVPGGPARVLHVLYSEDDYRARRRGVIVPAVLIGCVAAVLVAGLALLTASRVSRPLSRLRQQVGAIAEGDFRPITPPRRDDEVRELVLAVNQMATRLADYEDKIRRTEQVRTLAQLSSGLAHQLRNSVTGARMALDIHREECPQGPEAESLEVASRQVVLMEKHLQKFLTLGTRQEPRRRRLDVAPLVRELLPLVKPAAQHAGVELQLHVDTAPLRLRGDKDALQHLVLNLLVNAIEAAAQVQPQPAPAGHHPAVSLRVMRAESDRLRLVVEDNGPGPAGEIEATMFEPLVTTKRDGVGLGLAVARQAVEDHAGSLRWERRQDVTRFIVELPLDPEGDHRGDAAGSG